MLCSKISFVQHNLYLELFRPISFPFFDCHPGGGGYFTMGLDGDVRQFWVVFGLKILGLGYTFTGKFL